MFSKGVVRLRDSCTSKLIYSQVAQRCIKNTNTCQYHSDSGGLQTTSHKSTLLTSSYKNNLVEFCWRQHSSISCIKLLNIIDVSRIVNLRTLTFKYRVSFLNS
ncbi:unnamed protein product [Trichobilharzia regenti]|nr:unnamed protein product [Trichobilharzia regenti]